ncbi:MAG: hypothetical protein IKL68_03760 [Clostridia bacterium]|nr:hypothetical protein [Clostridia bacterium]
MKKNKGISLIVLVITIIIMIILATAVIISLNNAGIINHSSNAVNKWNEAENNTQDTINDLENIVLSEVEKLEKEYTLDYYADIQTAIAVINESNYSDETKKVSKAEAAVAVYKDKENLPNLVLVTDCIINTKLVPTVNMAINLAGKTLLTNDVLAIETAAINLTINGTKANSKIVNANTNGTHTSIIKVASGKCTINGGEYNSLSNGIGTTDNQNINILVDSSAILEVNNAKINSTDQSNGAIVGVYIKTDATAVITNTDITVLSPGGLFSDAIDNDGTLTATNSKLLAYADHTANAAGNNYGSSSRAVSNTGTITFKNCTVYGAHSGVRTTGTVYVDGGTYEGYSHGGFYFAGAQTTSYIRNATMRDCTIKNGEDDGRAGTNKAGTYIGNASNITVYIDNCDISGTYFPFVLRSSGGESNNSVYISNSTISNFEKYIRVDSAESKNVKLFIGSGNNFTAESAVYKEENTETTNVDYSTAFPNY